MYIAGASAQLRRDLVRARQGRHQRHDLHEDRRAERGRVHSHGRRHDDVRSRSVRTRLPSTTVPRSSIDGERMTLASGADRRRRRLSEPASAFKRSYTATRGVDGTSRDPLPAATRQGRERQQDRHRTIGVFAGRRLGPGVRPGRRRPGRDVRVARRGRVRVHPRRPGNLDLHTVEGL